MQVHAESLRKAIDKYTDPLDRLAAFATFGAETTGKVDEASALSRYRPHLGQSHPENMTVVLAPVVDLVRHLIQDAVDAGAIPPVDVDHHAYLLMSLKTAYLHSRIAGNELGVELPTPTELARFCLQGLNARLPDAFSAP